jgi:hypothetical protein
LGGRERNLRTFVSEFLGVVLEIGLHLGKEPSKGVLIASVLSRYFELSFTRLVNYSLELSILLLELSSLASKFLILGFEYKDFFLELSEYLL